MKERIGEEVRLAKLNVAKIEQEAATNTREEQRHLFQVFSSLRARHDPKERSKSWRRRR